MFMMANHRECIFFLLLRLQACVMTDLLRMALMIRYVCVLTGCLIFATLHNIELVYVF